MLYRENFRSSNGTIGLIVTTINFIHCADGGVASWGRGGGSRRFRCEKPPCFTKSNAPVSHLILQ